MKRKKSTEVLGEALLTNVQMDMHAIKWSWLLWDPFLLAEQKIHRTFGYIVYKSNISLSNHTVIWLGFSEATELQVEFNIDHSCDQYSVYALLLT